MAFATTYFEASHNEGQPDTPTVYTVAGWVGYAEQWADFEEKWLAILPPELDRFFHMSDFLNRKREYAHWNKDKRKTVFHGLAKLIGETVEHGFASSIQKGDYDAVVRSNMPRIKGSGTGPRYFGFNLIRVMEDIEEWADAVGQDDPIVYLFAGGDRAGNDIRNLFNRMIKSAEHVRRFRLHGPFAYVPEGNTRKEPRLQAADVLAVLANRRSASFAKYDTIPDDERCSRILGKYLGWDRKLKSVLYNNRKTFELWLSRAGNDVGLLFDPFEKGNFAGFNNDE
jgi:hypothetical protein